MTGVSIVIPFHNQVHWLILCVEALKRSTAGIDAEILIVDDQSNAAERALAERRCQSVTFLDNAEHRGFGGACMTGAGRAKYDHLLMLNSDCLVAPNTLAAMLDCFQQPEIAIVTALTNRAFEAEFPIFPGLSYVDMANILARTSAENGSGAAFVDSRTAEGHCLMVRADVLAEVGGFDRQWGIGYGEETDLHFKALEAGYRSVTSLATYVYHQGKQSFGTAAETEELKRRNHRAFLAKWGRQYRAAEHLSLSGPRTARRNISRAAGLPESFHYDIVFLLPGITQGVGGIQTVIDTVNTLILRGLRANIVVKIDSVLHDAEAMLFRPLSGASRDIEALVHAAVVVSTHQTTIPDGIALAQRSSGRHWNYGQGLETLFSQGLEAPEAYRNLGLVEQLVANSMWTARMLRPLIAEDAQISVAYPAIPEGLFLDRGKERDFDIIFFLRAAPDKGQHRLMDMLFRLSRRVPAYRLIVVATSRYFDALRAELDIESEESGAVGETVLGRLGSLTIMLTRAPLSRSQIASLFDRSRVYIDASDHEGFGLMAAEASLSGVRPICFDSGGFTSDFGSHCVTVNSGGDIQNELCDVILATIGDRSSSVGSIPYPFDGAADLFQSFALAKVSPALAKVPSASAEGASLPALSFSAPKVMGRLWAIPNKPRPMRRAAVFVWRSLPKRSQAFAYRAAKFIEHLYNE